MIGTASELERLLECPGSGRLHQIRSRTKAADKGTSKHCYLQLVSEGASPDDAIASVPLEWREVCAALPLDELPTNLAAEVAMAIDLSSGRAWEIGRGIDRDYGELPMFALAGTADVLGLGDDHVYVADYKGPGNRTRARDSVQLRLLALMACRAYSKPRATVERIRLGDDGQVWRDSYEYGPMALDAFEGELAKLASDAGRDAINEGPWCDYCPAMAHCPAKARLAVQLAEGRLFDVGEMLPLSPTRAGEAWVRLRAAKHLLAHIERAVIATLDEAGGELPLPTGKTLRRVVKPGNERLDGNAVHAAVSELFGAAVADRAVERHATKTGIRDALRGLNQARGQLAKSEALVLDKVRAAGGITRKPSSSLEEVD